MEKEKSNVEINRTREHLAYIGTFFFFSIVAYVVMKGLTNLSTESAFIIGNLTGMSGSIANSIYGYYFGSSTGSKEKDKHIKKMIDEDK